VYGALRRSVEGGFFDGLGVGRVTVANAGHVFSRSTVFHRHGQFHDEVGGAGTHDVGSEHLVGAGIGQMTREFRALPDVTSMAGLEPDPRFHAQFAQNNPDVELYHSISSELPDNLGLDRKSVV
jgi:hypothetical protein